MMPIKFKDLGFACYLVAVCLYLATLSCCAQLIEEGKKERGKRERQERSERRKEPVPHRYFQNRFPL